MRRGLQLPHTFGLVVGVGGEFDLGVLDKGTGLLFFTKRKAERIALRGVWRYGMKEFGGLGEADKQA